MNNLWQIKQTDYKHNDSGKYETVFTLANGYKGMRGWLEFSKYGIPGNLIAGIFNQADSQVTEIVNNQNPLKISMYADNEALDIETCEVLDFDRTLDMKEGILYTTIELKTKSGRITKISSERFVSKNDVHRWGIKYTIKPVNYSGKIFIENVIDGTVTNSSFDPMNKTKHLNVKELYDLEKGIALKTVTKDKGIEIVEGILLKAEDGVLQNRKYRELGEEVSEAFEIRVEEGKQYTVEKYGVTYTSRDTDKDPFELLKDNMDNFVEKGLEEEVRLHKEKWNETWDKIDIQIKGDNQAQLGIRFNLFQITASASDEDDRVSIAAKALHGEGYKGHVFWDTEIYMLPFFIYTNPKIAKNLLMYRYNTLEGARKNARENGYIGAQFPWEAADDGTEVTPKWGVDYDGNPVRIWTGDEEFHISSDIVFGIWEYYRATKDKDFLVNHGMEIVLDTSKFWSSRVEYNEEFDRYEINRVIGPDEFHEHVNNNVYTNYLAKWNLEKGVELAEWLKTENKEVYDNLLDKLEITEDDIKEWQQIADKVYIPRDANSRVIEQFEGYFDLKDIEITEHDENGMPIWPDLQGYKLGETQLIKQPDVVMLMLLLGDEFDNETKKENYEYYEKRTMHKSSLSPSMYSIMGLTVGDTRNAYRYFMKTVMTDLEDNQGNAQLGLHAASTGGSWQSVVFGFGGVYVNKEEILCLNPWLPEKWDELSFKVNWRGNILNISITKENVSIKGTDEAKIKVYEKEYSIEKDKEIVILR
ncbi:glycoside hydrolase family 65 protein [Caldisalinibacter kiritimatiensis]|uniref:glycoside hydrolase family 65 protein n=1 Tax=Caldisalinibacter kiritimatiensis TaxID=1304284 RepID=UPI0012DF2A4F|nr:glycosyl hydrolase family 65 protein [Caldisalinibacter kiritimatiensis]